MIGGSPSVGSSPTFAGLFTTGNAGIGQASPSSPGTVAVFLHVGSSAASSSSIVLQDNEKTFEFVNNGFLDIRDSTTSRLFIGGEGNVGIGTTSFGTSAVTVLGITTGTAPSDGPANTVQFYSSDDAAGHTIPSFYCEGTNVIATGQADSASSVRVKMRINGTVVTLLAI